MFEDRKFEGVDYTQGQFIVDEYENCIFNHCTFSEANLRDAIFLDCEFNNCDFSLAKIGNTAFRNVHFLNCKLLGLHFDACNPFLFTVKFTDCQLNLSSFFKVKLKQTVFTNCRLHEVDFVECDLTNSSFLNCDMSGAIFENAILEKADFRTAFNYSINPELNKIKKARFSLNGLSGLLDKYNIDIE